MASLLYFSSAPPSTTNYNNYYSSPHYPLSSFKGNTSNLGKTPFNFTCLKLHLRCIIKERRPLAVVASSSTLAPTNGSESGSGSETRFRLYNLGPQPGSRKKGKRKGRGHAAGQGKSCGFGMRGQRSRSGPGVMKGFEGGQMPLYRRIPKLRGIAGGMHAGLPKYVPVNLRDIEVAGFNEGEEVSLESLKAKGIINPSGRERKLPLKILGEGVISTKLHIKARAFSDSAKEKLEAAGCSVTLLPGRKKYIKESVRKNLARADEYFAKKRTAATTETESA